jgi:hypothetical protein
MSITVHLPESLITRLRTKGCTASYAAQVMGVGPRQAGHLLAKAGAKRSATKPGSGTWTMAKE